MDGKLHAEALDEVAAQLQLIANQHRGSNSIEPEFAWQVAELRRLASARASGNRMG